MHLRAKHSENTLLDVRSIAYRRMKQSKSNLPRKAFAGSKNTHKTSSSASLHILLAASCLAVPRSQQSSRVNELMVTDACCSEGVHLGPAWYTQVAKCSGCVCREYIYMPLPQLDALQESTVQGQKNGPGARGGTPRGKNGMREKDIDKEIHRRSLKYANTRPKIVPGAN